MEDLWAGSSSVVRREDLSVSLQKHIKKEKLLRKQLQDERKQSQDVIHKLEADKNLLSKKSLELIQKFKQKTSELEKEVELLSVSKKDLELVLKEKESRAKQLLALLPDIHSYNSYKALDSKIQDSNCNNGYNGSDSNNVMSADEGLSSQYNAKNSGTDLNFLGTGGYTVLATELAAIAGVLDKKSIGTGMDIGLPISYDTHFDQVIATVSTTSAYQLHNCY